jgi:protein-S-isoprenylcysteine O-methyltransferase Ste14
VRAANTGGLRRLNFPKPYADRVQKLRVPGGFVLVAGFLIFSQPTWESLFYGMPISIWGLALRGWAAGHLAKNKKLTTSGPYRFIRNPLYIGTLLVAAGLVLASRSWVLGAVFAGVFFLIYLPVIQLEEQHLGDLFPDFAKYKQRVPKLIPNGKSYPSGGEFDYAQYVKNREYRALFGFLAGVALLIAKVYIGNDG